VRSDTVANDVQNRASNEPANQANTKSIGTDGASRLRRKFILNWEGAVLAANHAANVLFGLMCETLARFYRDSSRSRL
jgi:hypothetical protein